MTIRGRSKARAGLLLVLLACGMTAAPNAYGIVTRHDRDDASYRALAARYPAALSLKPDGVVTLIAPHFVLTAAHVAQGTMQRNPHVVVDGTKVDVARVYFPPSWSGRGPHDIALLRLAQPITSISPVALYRKKEETGEIVTFVGTGDTGTGKTGPHTMDGIMRAATNRVDSSDKEWIFFTFNEGESATELEGVSGPGDSGGPAFIEYDGKLFLAGVSSHSRNGKPGRYGTVEGYTRVSSYADWVDAIISGESEEPGVVPGESRTNAAPEPESEMRAVVRGGGSMQSLAEIDAGEMLTAYLDTYNRQEDGAMTEFIVTHFSASYRTRKTMDELLGYYNRLMNDHVGNATARGVVEASEEVIIVRIAGTKGQEADFHFMLDADGRIDDMVVAIIDGAPRLSR